MSTPSDYIQAVAGGPHGMVWVVGSYTPGGAEFAASMLWNGKKWVAAPAVQAASTFLGVAFIPGGGAWAVGYFESGAGGALAAHWTGRAWQPAPMPRPGALGVLSAVAATSAHDAWAVGTTFPTPTSQPMTLILHWNGKAWS
jgi:hypothetical protein